MVTAEQIQDARGWIADCIGEDSWLSDADDALIVRVIDAEYEGGWSQFVVDGYYEEED